LSIGIIRFTNPRMDQTGAPGASPNDRIIYL